MRSRREGRAHRLQSKRDAKNNPVEAEPIRLNRHLTVDQLAARQKLEQLWLLTQTDLAILNSAEPYRLSSSTIFKRNLLDPTLYITATCVLLFTLLVVGSSSFLLTGLVFTIFYVPINNHIEGYRSFNTVNRNVKLLSKNYKLRRVFLSTHLGFNTSPSHAKIAPLEEKPETINPDDGDTFNWLNQIIHFFWPYLSHLIHFELNEFFRDQIESGRLARSEQSLKKLFYVLIRQLDTHILLIEKCQLGHQAPAIKCISAKERQGGLADGKGNDKTLVYDINLEYNGDMNIALIYKYFCCCSSRMGLKDVFLHLKIRLVLGPIRSDAPFIDQVSFTLLDMPQFGYKGIALVELAELKVVRGVINRLVREHILQPHCISVGLKALVETLMSGPAPRQREQTTNKSRYSGDGQVPLWTRLAASVLLCGCMCSNFCLMPSQSRRNNKQLSDNR